MNIQNLLNINFSGNIEDKKGTDRRPYLAPQKPDTFERTTAPKTEPKKDTVLNKIAKMYSNVVPMELDSESTKIIEDDKLDKDKIKSLSKDMMTSKTETLTLERAAYDGKNNYILSTTSSDDSENIKLLDKDLNVLEQETIHIKYDSDDNPVSKKVMTTDFRTNTFNETKFEYTQEGYPVMSEAVKIKRDAQNRLIRKETYEKSDIEGMYNVKYEFPNGKTRQLSKATKDKNTGAVLIEKDMRSSDMTRTQYRYEDDPNGNRIIDYKITSPDGKVLMNQSQTFEVLNKNTFRSSRNNKSYLIELDNKNKILKVTDEQKKKGTTEIDLKDMIKGKKTNLINLLKTIPGDELINLDKNVFNIKEADDKLSSYCQSEAVEFDDDDQEYMYSTMLLVPEDAFVFLHELGHATDIGGKPVDELKNKQTGKWETIIRGSLRDDKKFKKIYDEERKNFLKEFPTNEREHINYFIADEALPGRPKQGKNETIAETNALLNTYQTTNVLGIRTQYLQQHFPKTIAYLSAKLIPTK